MCDISVFQSKHFKGTPKYVCKVCICLLVMFRERVYTTQIWVCKKKLDCLEFDYPIFMGIHVGRLTYANFACVYDITLKSDNK